MLVNLPGEDVIGDKLTEAQQLVNDIQHFVPEYFCECRPDALTFALTKGYMHDPQYWNDPNNREGAGLGIFVRKSDYGETFFHGGNNGDFKCMFEVYKDLKMGYVCYTNSDTGSELTIDLWQLLIEGKKEKQ